MNIINVGDYIYGVTTESRTGAAKVETATVLTVGKVRITTSETCAGLNYRHTHKREDVFTSQREALLAYRETTVQLLLIVGRSLAKGHVTLESIDEQLEVGGE